VGGTDLTASSYADAIHEALAMHIIDIAQRGERDVIRLRDDAIACECYAVIRSETDSPTTLLALQRPGNIPAPFRPAGLPISCAERPREAIEAQSRQTAQVLASKAERISKAAMAQIESETQQMLAKDPAVISPTVMSNKSTTVRQCAMSKPRPVCLAFACSVLRKGHRLKYREIMAEGRGEHERMPHCVLEAQAASRVEYDADRVERTAYGQQRERERRQWLD
jgi:hypothetical protein